MTNLAVLNDMAADDFAKALKQHDKWNLRHLDLRDRILGSRVAELTEEQATQARHMIDTHGGLEVYCFSTHVFNLQVNQGENAWNEHLSVLDQALQAAAVLRPKYVRVVAGQLAGRDDHGDVMRYLTNNAPWVFEVYREAASRIADAGFTPLVENESHNCFMTEPRQILDFYAKVDHPELGFTWDVLNHWSAGVFPSLEVYETLKPIIRYYHAKGGRGENDGDQRLVWNVALEETSWPVAEITQRVVDDGVSPVICLNPPQHGQDIAGYDYGAVTARDLAFLRNNVEGIR